MPYNRPGNIFYTTNDSGGTVPHGAPCAFDGVVGVAIKQRSVSWTAGLAAHGVIADTEKMAMIVKGIVEVDDVTGFADGDPVYIDDEADVTNGASVFALTETVGTNAKFGRVVEIVGDGRGVPTGKVRIDLDKKDSF